MLRQVSTNTMIVAQGDSWEGGKAGNVVGLR